MALVAGEMPSTETLHAAPRPAAPTLAGARRNTPGALFALAAALGVAAPAIVYFIPDSSAGLVAAQAVLAGAAGAAAVGLYFGSSLIAALQKAD